MNGMTAEAKIQKAHVTLMSNPITALMSGIIMMGKSVVLDDNWTHSFTPCNTLWCTDERRCGTH